MDRRLALISVVLLLAAVAAGALWHLGDLRAQRGVARVPAGEAVMIGGPFSLIDQDGVRRTDADFRGKYMLIFFGYTYCPDVCPTTLAVMAEALSDMGARAERIAPILITVDPGRDRPEVLKDYLQSFGPRFVGLTGTAEEIAAAARAYRVYYQANPAEDGDSYTVDHSGIVYLMDPNGRFVTHYSLETTPDAMAADLMRQVQR